MIREYPFWPRGVQHPGSYARWLTYEFIGGSGVADAERLPDSNGVRGEPWIAVPPRSDSYPYRDGYDERGWASFFDALHETYPNTLLTYWNNSHNEFTLRFPEGQTFHFKCPAHAWDWLRTPAVPGGLR